MRPGTGAGEAGTAARTGAARELGLRVERIEEPGTLDGGDVLQVGDTVYAGPAALLAADGLRVTRVDISEFEALDGCVTCLSVLVPGRPQECGGPRAPLP